MRSFGISGIDTDRVQVKNSAIGSNRPSADFPGSADGVNGRSSERSLLTFDVALMRSSLRMMGPLMLAH